MLRIIGDVHGKYSEYLSLIKDVDYSLQIGDFGFDYSILDNVDVSRHRILAGNHDNYNSLIDYPHFLGDFGTYSFPNFEFFFVRGGRSIDKHLRVGGLTWWAEEELNFTQTFNCIEDYKAKLPQVVITHEAPSSVNKLICDNNYDISPSYTSNLLQHLFEIHRPKLWIFGHWHRKWSLDYYDANMECTKFYCLDELQYLDFDNNGNIL